MWIAVLVHPLGIPTGLCIEPPGTFVGYTACELPLGNPEYEYYAICADSPPSNCGTSTSGFSYYFWTQGTLPEDHAISVDRGDCYVQVTDLPECCPENGPFSILAKTSDTGTKLKELISWFVWSKKARQCKTCKDRETTMNQWGPDKCERNIEIIVGWLQESAIEHNLPFSIRIAKAFIRKAIEQSRKSN